MTFFDVPRQGFVLPLFIRFFIYLSETLININIYR